MKGIMPDEVFVKITDYGRCPPRSLLFCDNGHFEGHYPAYTMVPYKQITYQINY